MTEEVTVSDEKQRRIDIEQLEEKDRQIMAAYANATGCDIAELSDAEVAVLWQQVSGMIDEAEEALAHGDTPDDWRAREERLAATPLGRLILERHEIEQQLLDERDEENL